MPGLIHHVDYNPFAGPALERVLASTAAQKEIWMAARMGNDLSCAFNESISLRLRGPLEEAKLRHALQGLLNHHEALRATFSPDDGRLCIAGEGKLSFAREDLSNLEPPAQQQRLAALRAEEVETPFDLEQGPLMRARLLHLGPQEHWFMLTGHHIVCDGWSMAVMLRDLGLLYSEAVVPPANPFSEYARWAAEQEKATSYEQARRYWLERLQGDLPVLQMPVDRPRPPLKTYRSARYDHVLERDVVDGLKKLSARAGTSFFTALLSVYGVFLHRLTGQQDLVIGVPAAGQSASGLENVVGHCVNLLPIRCQVEPASTFSRFLQEVRGLVLDAYEHQQISFGQLLPHLKLPRDPSRTPLVSAVFNLDQAVQAKHLPFAGLEAEYYSNPRHFENFEIFINASEAAGRVTLECQYNTDLFDDETIRAWLESFEALLGGAVAQPEQALAKLPMLTRKQEQQILVEWNATALEFARDKTVSQLIEEQAQRCRSALRFTSARSPSPTANWKGAPTSWPTIWPPMASTAACSSACAWSAPSTWSSACWRSSRRGPAMCRWTQSTRANASPSWRKTRGRPSF